MEFLQLSLLSSASLSGLCYTRKPMTTRKVQKGAARGRGRPSNAEREEEELDIEDEHTPALRGYAVIKARTDLEMRRFVPTIESEQLREEIALEVIHKGRPTKYTEDLEDPARDMPTRIFRYLSDVSNGMRTIDGCAAMLGVTDTTLRLWQREHERFSSAVQMGKKWQEMMAAQRMSQGIMYPTSLIFTMKNLHNWADKIEQTHSFSLTDMMKNYKTEVQVVNWDRPNLPVLDTVALSESNGGDEIADSTEDVA